ncbi:MAG TPA: thioredoxin family protein [Allocoleopsis sp.]
MVLSVRELTFTQEVLESSTPVLVHFWAPWCSLCKLINPLLMGFQSQWGSQIKLVGINADESLKLAATYQLKNLPTLILFHQGKIIERLDNFYGRDDLRLALEKITFNTVNH